MNGPAEASTLQQQGGLMLFVVLGQLWPMSTLCVFTFSLVYPVMQHLKLFKNTKWTGAEIRKQCFCRVATFFREIGRSDSKIHMLMSEVVNNQLWKVVYKLSKSIFCAGIWRLSFRLFIAIIHCCICKKMSELSEFWASATRSQCRESRTVASHLGRSAKSDNYI